jgi:coproporphyrinogen III oxidase-like Fe-S oxidoreductase
MTSLFIKLAALITRNEGKKFLKLAKNIDENIIKQYPLNQNNETSLYIHIPFCRTLCPFCCFNRYLFKEDIARQYFKSLKKELGLYIDYGYKFSDFYFGGGTPTIFMEELFNLVDYLKMNFPVRQISLETTPREITPENIELLQKIGVNRLSIGVQSFNNDVVKAMGRVQCDGEEAKDRVMLAQGRFDTLNVDFVFNFPFQSIEQFENDINVFKTLGIDQATFYPLMASPHKKDALERKFNRVDTSRELEFYRIIIDQLYNTGYKASTAWCFSRGDRMIDEYIIEYDDYIGIGSGSVSMFNGNFMVNTFSLEHYNEMIDGGKLPVVGWRKLSERENIYYYLLTKLFGVKFDSRNFTKRFHSEINSKLAMEMLLLKLLKIIDKKDSQIKVTDKGMYPVSVMMREFFTSLNSLREFYIENQI